jgi:hypothetical protein
MALTKWQTFWHDTMKMHNWRTNAAPTPSHEAFSVSFSSCVYCGANQTYLAGSKPLVSNERFGSDREAWARSKRGK